jgi:carbamoyltransferase
MFLGINLSHDASSALLDKQGQIIYAIGEERISRVKNHIGVPLLAVEEILKENPNIEINKVVYGSHKILQPSHLDVFLAQEDGNPSSQRGKALPTYPGYKNVGFPNVFKNPETVHQFLTKKIPALKEAESEFIRHHDSHIGCAIPLAGDRDTLVVSLDGSGDGESGVISLFKSDTCKLTTLCRISELDSIGLLYSVVTSKYNFKPAHHEGKITGLAAFGRQTNLIDNFYKFTKVKNGKIKVRVARSRLESRLLSILKEFGIKPKVASSLDDLVNEVISASGSFEYADLAFAIQKVLEESVCQIIQYWMEKTSVHQVALTGGVFANVKLNQKISELEGVRYVKVFPNMGDGGIAIGAVWSYMQSQGINLDPGLISTMYLGTPFESRKLESKSNTIQQIEYSENHVAKEIVRRILEGRVVAVLNGRMEFGPRALGNTSILLDPRDRKIIGKVNSRLKRTEFMPFAPCIIGDEFENWFSTKNQTLQPFEFMTMTCDVIQAKQEIVPAITHIDGTARPQIVTPASNKFLLDILVEFQKETGIPILVNTSFNVHEEPIIRDTHSALSALDRGAVDDLFVGTTLYFRD